MSTLTIYTFYPDTVAKLLLSEQLVENDHVISKLDILLRIKHPQEAMSQVLAYWLAMAQGCGLVTSHSLDRGGRA